jgi:flagellar basal body-associated protein FliL
MSKKVIIALCIGVVALAAAFIMLIMDKNKELADLENIEPEPEPKPKPEPKTKPKVEPLKAEPEPVNSNDKLSNTVNNGTDSKN